MKNLGRNEDFTAIIEMPTEWLETTKRHQMDHVLFYVYTDMCLPYHDNLGSSGRSAALIWQDAMQHRFDDHFQSWMLVQKSSGGSASRELVGLETSP